MTNIGNSAAVDEAITKFDKELIDVSFAPMFNVTLLSLGGNQVVIWRFMKVKYVVWG